MNLFLNGLTIVVNPLLYDKVLLRKCRSSKKRILKKWRKNPDNYKQIPSRSIYRTGQFLIMHPAMKEEVLKALKGAP